MTASAPPLQGIVETALYCADLSIARRFYETVMGLQPMLNDPRLVAYPVVPAQVLLLFRRAGSTATALMPGSTVPPHDGSGQQHLAFAVANDALAHWEQHLGDHGIAIEHRTDWPAGGRSVYFRDPDQHLLELATPGVWRNY